MTIKALGHHVLVKVEAPEEISAGGIYIAKSTRDAEQMGAEVGEVMDVGPVAWTAEGLGGVPWAQIGDKVWFAKYAGKWVQEGNQKLLILLDTDIVAKIEEAA